MTKTHIAFPLTIFYGTGIGTLIYSIIKLGVSVWTGIGVFVLGALFFSLLEYLVHRYFYHIEGDTPKKKRMQYMFHGVHHDHPRDTKRLALPPLVSAVIATVFILLFWGTMGVMGFAFGGGFLIGYALYLMIHYIIHVFNPPKNFFAALWKNHNLHHFADHDRAFGVSSPLWDYVFGTMPRVPAARQTGGNTSS